MERRNLSPASEVEDLLKHICKDLEAIKQKGAFAFDIDHTLMPSDEFLSDHPELKYLLVNLLKAGVRLVFISGGPGAVVESRILHELRMTPGVSVHLNQLTVYANGGSSIFTADANGVYGEDSAFTKSNQIPAEHVEGVKTYLEKEITERFGLEEEQFQDLILAWKKKRETQWHERKIKFEEVWGQTLGEFSLSLLEDDVMAAVKKGEGSVTVSFPFINTRSSEYDGAGKLVGVAGFTPTGFYALREDKGDFTDLDIRDRLIEKVQSELKEATKLVFRKAGRSSIDITKSGTDKASALLHFINAKGLAGQHVYYFGDEFYKGGNDMPVAECKKLKDNGVHALSLNLSEKPEGLLWIGSGPKALLAFLQKVMGDS